MAEFSDLIGKEIERIHGLESGSEYVTFKCSDGTVYNMEHYQDCCERVEVVDVCGDIDDIIDQVIVVAEESTSNEKQDGGFEYGQSESFTWTFYRLGSANGVVVFRWLGASNGYYGEEVSFSICQ